MMNDGMLSQEEIDALLNISDEDKSDENKQSYLSDIEIDALGEIGNISFGSSATTLSTLLNQKVEITTPIVDVIERTDIGDEFTFEPVSIQVNYIEGFTGKNVFVIKAGDAAIIANIMLGGDGTNPDSELNEIHLSAVQEAMNQMMGAAATSMSTVFNKRVDISPPSILDEEVTGVKNEDVFDEEVYVKVFFKLTVGNLINSNMMQLIPLRFAKELVNELLNGSEEHAIEKKESAATLEAEIPVTENSVAKQQEQAVYNNSLQAETRDDPAEPQYLGHKVTSSHAEVHQAAFSDFEKVELNTGQQRNLDMLLDIPLKVTVELGRTKKSINDILELASGSIIELDKLAGEPVDILVNDKLVAEGEVVVIEENFGVRVTDIISQYDRIRNLK
ncbi:MULTISPECIES: flagellar motor switch phosphatase FliY [Oceanobacillus]|uniref:Flagellar motor switch phosphatase FliY n=1 Tax=Oceanobacillus profundus TaxID=372463 RepID=A0A417YK71_9BACI|nr:flagellar motor switch phosphatase FliY [Oceanobacillus profundus]MBR3121570.1 flagellar motor switch phosphatase FliY [Oceanobacillus sp.]MCM3396362.1 flagellar motor switch phosphatase FliY [Oceanobacillus profundus]RHW33632.1 flagellar motor switch phosphatase FliY [Oceanobacillus profundus]